ncbi:DNA ligase D [Chitinophaga sp. GCM10012297]|uniref:DNA ligase (ATP) n=1 Tax=Chitinophaga chungangae TaxID=2821488 RepID=A0ABS3YFH0_9BACT|nr:DNA ligase D [Chitinophaga chungangae]MBO9153068.1 DNA ligase D [Chitinophaga chungangae]
MAVTRTIKKGKAIKAQDKPAAKKAAMKIAAAAKKPAGKTAAAAKPPSGGMTVAVKKAPAKPLPSEILPMLATLVDQPFDREGWLYEIKWDGYRAIAFMKKGMTELRSRNNKSFNEKFYPVYAALEKWGINAVVDGEVVVVNEQGTANFSALQQWRSEADGELQYFVFDLLWYQGKDLTGLPLTARREQLKKLIPKTGLIRLSHDFETSGEEMLNAAREMGLEGILAKKADSLYHSGERTKEWLKIKSQKRQEVVIGGYTKNEDSSKPFSALLVGVYNKGKLEYTGKVGTGFNQQQQKDMLQQFKPLLVKKSPFTTEPDVNKPSRFRPNPPKAQAFWLKPSIVAEVSFAEMTSDGVMRHPSFEGLREDKKAQAVGLEKEIPVSKIVSPLAGITPRGESSRKTLLNPTDETQVRKVNGEELKFTNLSKIYWPKEKITKRDLINYYYRIAPFILPYLKNRPQSLNRHPNGITGESFYQKDVTGKVPAWIEQYPYETSEGEKKNFMLATDEASLLYMAGLGCIELNPWSSTIKKPEHPTWCIIDLDPAKQSFDQVVEAALVTKSVLDDMGVPCYCKTSGSTGLHIYIPLGAKYTYEQSKEFARIIVTLVHREIPRFTSIERAVRDRGGKMYLDFLQNRPHATLAAPYALRPKPGATVSMPLEWNEVKKGLRMKDFNIFNAAERAESLGDIFKPVLGKGIALQAVISKYRSKNG